MKTYENSYDTSHQRKKGLLRLCNNQLLISQRHHGFNVINVLRCISWVDLYPMNNHKNYYIVWVLIVSFDLSFCKMQNIFI